ncbi:DUF6783 domain-containing protein [Blautia wexlerae]|uniref:DUF6783 domain-containing protein n=1 Tax=Blautia wexlerae TaxID=418240 RepID=UPI003D6B705F
MLIQQRLFVNVTFRCIECFCFTNGTYFAFSSNTPLERVCKIIPANCDAHLAESLFQTHSSSVNKT